MLFLQLFYTFFKIGLFGFGGGYAMLSMIQGEVVTRYGWLTSQEFTDIVAISQMTPGPIGINSATYVGYTTIAAHYGTSMGVLGSCIATFAVVLPSFILMLTISKFFLKYQKHPAVEAVFSGLRPAVVGLLASAALVLMNAENFSSPDEDMYSFIISIIIFLIAFIGTRKYKANPHINDYSVWNSRAATLLVPLQGQAQGREADRSSPEANKICPEETYISSGHILHKAAAAPTTSLSLPPTWIRYASGRAP